MSKWIKIQDKTPPLDTWVLCYFRDMNYFYNRILSLKFYMYMYTLKDLTYEMPMFSSIDRSWRAEEISHWMEFPQAPKEEEAKMTKMTKELPDYPRSFNLYWIIQKKHGLS